MQYCWANSTNESRRLKMRMGWSRDGLEMQREGAAPVGKYSARMRRLRYEGVQQLEQR
jgi:hypothetical protein